MPNIADIRLATVGDCQAAWSYCHVLQEALEDGCSLSEDEQRLHRDRQDVALLDLANAREAQAAQAAVWVERSTGPIPEWLRQLQEAGS